MFLEKRKTPCARVATAVPTAPWAPLYTLHTTPDLLLNPRAPLYALLLLYTPKTDPPISWKVTINNLGIGRDVDETLRLLQAHQFLVKHGEVSGFGLDGWHGMQGEREG